MGGNYTVSINVKDGGILQQLAKLEKDGISVKGGGGSGSILQRLESINANSLLKLAGIGVGVGSLVHLLQKSSGLLQGQLKMLETGFMLILKPIGDFFGLLLRPFVAMFWQVALPFYKWAAPLFHQYGTKIGEFFADPANALAGLATLIGAGVATALVGKKIWGGITDSLADKLKCNCGGSSGGKHSGDCIRICDMPTPSVPTPTPSIPMPTPMPFPIPSFNPFPQPTGPTPPGTQIPSSATNHNGFWFGGNKDWWNNIGKKEQGGGVIEQMNVAAEGSSASVMGAQQEWGAVETASAAAAVAAGAAAMYWDEAVQALGTAVSRLQSFAGSIPNSFTIGLNHFGSTTTMAVAPTTTAAIADTLE